MDAPTGSVIATLCHGEVGSWCVLPDSCHVLHMAMVHLFFKSFIALSVQSAMPLSLLSFS